MLAMLSIGIDCSDCLRRPLLSLAAGAMVALPFPSDAQEDVLFSIDPTESCLAAAPDLPGAYGCIGKSASTCMTASDAGRSRDGSIACLDHEIFWWEARLTKAEAELREKALLQDSANGFDADAPWSLQFSLTGMTDAWSAFRDAACTYAIAKYSGGSGMGAANLRCLLELTGQRALWLENEVRSY